jgi:DNA-binding CsgD family transcriptional regulator
MDLADYTEAVTQCRDMASLAGLVREAIAPLGMTAAASGLVSGSGATSANPFHFAEWPSDWAALYVAREFLLIDPIPRWARISGLAIPWSALFARLSSRDPGQAVVRAAADFGFNEGMAVPARAANNALGLVSFGGARGALDPVEQVTLAMVARTAFEAAERISGNSAITRPAAILTTREIECLVLLVRGHTDRQIAKLLGLSEATARFHLTNAREKSGAVSRTHLAALAVAQGWVAL